MKRFMGLLMCVILLGAASAPALAQTSRRNHTRRAAKQRRYDQPRDVYYHP